MKPRTIETSRYGSVTAISSLDSQGLFNLRTSLAGRLPSKYNITNMDKIHGVWLKGIILLSDDMQAETRTVTVAHLLIVRQY